MSVHLNQHGLEALQATIPAMQQALARHIAQHLIDQIAARWSAQSPAPPGDPPAIDTGALADSITLQVGEDGALMVGSSLDYAARLEFGGQTLAARPWLRPALDRVRGEVAILAAERFGTWAGAAPAQTVHGSDEEA